MNNRKNWEALRPFGVETRLNESGGSVVLEIVPQHTRRIIPIVWHRDVVDDAAFDPATEGKAADQRIFRESNPSAYRLAMAARDFARFSKTAGQINGDTGLTDPRKLTDTQAALRTFLPTLGGHFADLQGISAELKRKDEMLYEPGCNEDDDAVVNGNLLLRLEGLDDRRRAEIFRNLGDPRYFAIAQALARDEWPRSEEEHAAIKAGWRAQTALEFPDEVQAQNLAEQYNGLALDAVRTIAHHAIGEGFDRSKPVLARQALYETLNPTGGLSLFEFGGHEVPMFEHRIAAAAAAKAAADAARAAA